MPSILKHQESPLPTINSERPELLFLLGRKNKVFSAKNKQCGHKITTKKNLKKGIYINFQKM